jgi:hypothetical protein
MQRIAKAGATLLLIAIATAIFIQDHTDVLPLGLLNKDRDQYTYLANACLIVTLAVLVSLSVEAWRGRQWRFASAVRGCLTFLIVGELLLFGLDRLFVSRNPQSWLGGPYYERQTAHGTWVFLKKAPIRSTLGFRTDHPYKRVPDHPRILFLGDSYTEGSGRSSACNYPSVVEKVLRDQRGDVEVMNAGVAGYGPVDALNLLGLLREEGYRFDALVYNLFTENDFTDNLPATNRRIVGGLIFRSPRSWFLRTFHPLNSYLVRYALVIWQLSTLSTEQQKAISLESGDCIYSEENPNEVSPLLRQLIQQRLAGSQRVAQSKPAQQEFVGTISAMKAEADKLGIPFIIVVFPDRVVVDAELRERLNVGAEQLAPLHSLHALVYQAVPETPVLEVAEALQGHPGMYRTDDTHLSDLGNKIAGYYVGKKLVEQLATSRLEAP